ncbi:MAG: hypothetical protein ACTS9Y_00425 [Methylophilus sp.]|uniref:hypothetical protein n=1 Tax=Methylophilus sp. TaxID=29541 RepID=UPI003FA0E038
MFKGFTAGSSEGNFPHLTFTDCNGTECILQTGRTVEKRLWIGTVRVQNTIFCRDAEKLGLKPESNVGHQIYPIPSEVFQHAKVEIDRETAIALVGQLQKFIDTGRID